MFEKGSGIRWLIVAVPVVAAAAAWFVYGPDGGKAVAYQFAKVDRGAIAQTVSSSGTLNPVVNVQVGSQVSGQISELLADFNTEVKARQVIARIDPAPFEARMLEARADLAVMRANVAMDRATQKELEADVKGARAALREVELELSRKKSLLQRRVVAQSEVDKATAARDQMSAKLESAQAKIIKQKAQLQTALARVEQKAATLRQRELDVEHTIIRSPVSGVVISRNIDIGQTVAASLQAPVLFTIAQDLRRMQVEVSVDEADIGRIRESQNVTFTVDAYPGREFSGSVQQIRKAPREVSNVITYTVVVSAENPDLALLPGMTANVEVIVGHRESALRVPTAAFRFRPAGIDGGGGTTGERSVPVTGADRAAAARARSEAQIKRLTTVLSLSQAQQDEIRAIYADMGRIARQMRQSGTPLPQLRQERQKLRAKNNQRIEALLNDEQRRKFHLFEAENVGQGNRRGQVWIMDVDGKPKPVDVVTGISDGSLTEIVQGDLKAGDRIIVGTAAAGTRSR